MQLGSFFPVVAPILYGFAFVQRASLHNYGFPMLFGTVSVRSSENMWPCSCRFAANGRPTFPYPIHAIFIIFPFVSMEVEEHTNHGGNAFLLFPFFDG